MQFRNILITGGAGFVGSNLAIMLKQEFSDVDVTALDNLKRRGSELNLPALRRAGVRFEHGDVRCMEDLETSAVVDLLIDCSAEPSVSAGLDGSPGYVLQANLVGTLNCLELARRRDAALLFLSTSRVYPIGLLNSLACVEEPTRFRWTARTRSRGFSGKGIAEDFPLDGARSLYGASKLAAELVLGEYVHSYGVKALINRCGLLAGPGQLSRVDQGVVTLWVARHYYRMPLHYIGFGGEGKQVRDVLHVRDLFELILRQLRTAEDWDGAMYNVGGGLDRSVSLKELTTLCQSVTGNQVEISAESRTSDVDVRIYITDNARVEEAYGWRPHRRVEQLLSDIHGWIDTNPEALKPVLT